MATNVARPPNASGVTHFVGIDVEGTGQCMRTNFMPRFGAAVVEIETGECLERFCTFVKPPSPEHGWEQRCLDEFWLRKPEPGATEARLAEIAAVTAKYHEICAAVPTAPTPDEAGQLFMAWIGTLVARFGAQSLMFVSDTAGYDYAWLSTVLPKGTSLLYAFGSYRPVFACSNFYGGVAGVTPTHSLWGLLGACAEKLNIEKPASPTAVHDHNPMNDAETIAYEAAAIVREVNKGAAPPAPAKKRALVE